MTTSVRTLKAVAEKMQEAPVSPEASAVLGGTPSAPSIVPQLIENAAAAWWSKFTEGQRQRINGRFERGLAIALAGDVAFTDDPEVFFVRSQSTRGNYRYTVTINPDNRSCSCPDVDAPGHVCKHIIAAHIMRKALELYESTQIAPEQLTPPAEQSPTAVQSPADEAALRAAANYKLRYPKDSIVYATLDYNGKPLPVEILGIENERALVRALPRVENGVIIPNFPFPSPFGGDPTPCWSSCEVSPKALTGVNVYS